MPILATTKNGDTHAFTYQLDVIQAVLMVSQSLIHGWFESSSINQNALKYSDLNTLKSVSNYMLLNINMLADKGIKIKFDRPKFR